MFEHILELLKITKIKDTTDPNILILKGLYKLPTSFKEAGTQWTFGKQLKAYRDGRRESN